MATEAEKNFFAEAGAVVSAVYSAAIRDGVIDAFLRQGAGELGSALKAFPDSIQVDEPGQVFNPLYSDIAADKRAAASVHGKSESADQPVLSPSDIADGKADSIYGTPPAQSMSQATVLSPSEIADMQEQSRSGQNHAQELTQERGGLGR